MIAGEVKLKIQQHLPGAQVEVTDESQEHLGHSGNSGGAHLRVMVNFSGFADKTMVEQHQMIYNILKEEMKEKIHALGLKTKVENE